MINVSYAGVSGTVNLDESFAGSPPDLAAEALSIVVRYTGLGVFREAGSAVAVRHG
jgi:hypothetical protein